MNRRDFMKGILAAGMAPAIVKAENIMRITPLERRNLWLPVSGRIQIIGADGSVLGSEPFISEGESIRSAPVVMERTWIASQFRLIDPFGRPVDFSVNGKPSSSGLYQHPIIRNMQAGDDLRITAKVCFSEV